MLKTHKQYFRTKPNLSKTNAINGLQSSIGIHYSGMKSQQTDSKYAKGYYFWFYLIMGGYNREISVQIKAYLM
jgi:hypothetical protein